MNMASVNTIECRMQLGTGSFTFCYSSHRSGSQTECTWSTASGRLAACLFYSFLSGSLRESSDWCCTECRRERWNTTAQEHIISSPQHREKRHIHCKHVQTRGPNSLKLSTLTRLFHMQLGCIQWLAGFFSSLKKRRKKGNLLQSRSSYFVIWETFGVSLGLHKCSSAVHLYILRKGRTWTSSAEQRQPDSSAFFPWFSHILPAFILLDKPLSIS